MAKTETQASRNVLRIRFGSATNLSVFAGERCIEQHNHRVQLRQRGADSWVGGKLRRQLPSEGEQVVLFRGRGESGWVCVGEYVQEEMWTGIDGSDALD